MNNINIDWTASCNMDFVLNENHNGVTNEDLLADIVAVAIKLNKNTVSCEEYSIHGKYHRTTFSRRFGSWQIALKKAGLKTYRELNNWCSSMDEFIEDLKAVAQYLGQDTLTTGEYKQYGRFQYLYPSKHHGLGWNDVLTIANLAPTYYRLGHGKEISVEELFADIERVWTLLGRQPTVTDVKKGYFKFSQNTFCRRFGGWRKTLMAFVEYINNYADWPDILNKSAIDSSEETTTEMPQQKHKNNREPNLRLRFKVMQRDGFKCCLCGRSPANDTNVKLVLDHIYPWSKGGETTYDNLQTLCQECNLGKSDLI